jgi:hypothetical protein
MKKLDSSRVSFALTVALSWTLSFVVVNSIAADGMKAIAALKSLRSASQPLHVRSNLAAEPGAASARVC